MTTQPVPTCTDDLLAEIEAEYGGRARLDSVVITWGNLMDILARLHADEKDVERLEFMIVSEAAIDVVRQFSGDTAYRITWPYRAERPLSLRRSSVRAAIDAAMEASK